MSLPVDIIRRSIITTALANVTNAINAVPGGKYVLLIGAVAATVATGAYFWGGKVWSWIWGKQPNPIHHLPNPKPAAQSKPQPAAQPQSKPQETIEPKKYVLLHKDFEFKRLQVNTAWEMLCKKRKKFIKQFGKTPYALSDTMLSTLSIDQNNLEKSVGDISDILKTLAHDYREGDSKFRTSIDLKYETELKQPINTITQFCIEETKRHEDLYQDLTKEYRAKKTEIQQEKLSADQNAKLVEELKAKLAALGAKPVSPNTADVQHSSPSNGSNTGIDKPPAL